MWLRASQIVISLGAHLRSRSRYPFGTPELVWREHMTTSPIVSMDMRERALTCFQLPPSLTDAPMQCPPGQVRAPQFARVPPLTRAFAA